MYTGGIKEITVVEARQNMEKGAPLIDVSEIYEWNRAHAEGAIHIPMASLLKVVAEIAKDKLDAAMPLMLICSNGQRTISAAGRLTAAGYSAVSVHGGTAAWKSAGYPVVKRSR